MSITRHIHLRDSRSGVQHSCQLDTELSTRVHCNTEVECAAYRYQILHAAWALPVVEVGEDDVDRVHMDCRTEVVKLVWIHIGSQRNVYLLANGTHTLQAPRWILEVLWLQLLHTLTGLDSCPNFAGATYEKLEKLNGVQWPCRDKSMADTGTSFLHRDGVFAHPGGKGKFYATEWRSPIELENEEFPLSFCTVREVGHYSVRTMSGNCRALRGMEDEPGWIQMSIEDCEALGIKTGELVKVVNKRGWCLTRALATERVAKGATYMTYQWWIGACNELTVGKNLDPIAGTPEFKYCNCRVERIDDQEWAEKYLLTEYRQLRERMGIQCIGEQRVGGVKAPATKGGK